MTRTEQLANWLGGLGVPSTMLEHRPSGSSASSAEVRAEAGFPHAVGAKALILRAEPGFLLFVSPGTQRMDNRAMRERIGKFRFATIEEVQAVSAGLLPGTIPPFGSPVLPGVDRLLVDRRLFDNDTVGFNAASPVHSIVMTSHDYQHVLDISSNLGSIVQFF